MTRTAFLVSTVAALAASAAAAGASAAPAGGDCASLVGFTRGQARVTAASLVAVGDKVGNATVTAPACRVRGTTSGGAGSLVNFEVWLPADPAHWTGRLKVDGTGGFAGATPVARLAQDVAHGFAAAGSDMGHVGGQSVDWTGHPEKLKDWGYRAHYLVTTVAKDVARAYYGRAVRHAYFEGCSNGGRQAMMMAQRYPSLFDGIVAGAPSMFYPDTLMSIVWTGHTLVPQPGQSPAIGREKLALVSARVMAACDAQDGLSDGQITNPLACRLEPAQLRCSAGGSGDCLTDAELAALQAVYRGVPTPDGQPRWQGPVLGSESEWQPNFADNGGYAAFIGHVVFGQPTPPFTPRSVDLVRDYDRIKTALTPWFAAPSPDLRRFRARGGKLIQYHGWSDQVVVPQGSINYARTLAVYERLRRQRAAAFEPSVERLSAADVTAAMDEQGRSVRDFHRLFMLPHVGHCSGGTGPSLVGATTGDPPAGMADAEHDMVMAVVQWVEQGRAPERLIATRVTNGAVVRQRPLCVFPKEPRYRGSGDVDAAESFQCVDPAGGAVTDQDLNQIRNSLRQRAVLSPTR
jgi:feruloyl esterase